LAATSIAFSSEAMAQSMSKSQYRAAEKKIEALYNLAVADCDSFENKAKGICMAAGNGLKEIAKKELIARYKPSKKADYELSIAKAEAEYSVAKEKCEDKTGNIKDICMSEAKAILLHAKTAAKTQLMSSKAVIIADDKPPDARNNEK
jgi:hypothetical protein